MSNTSSATINNSHTHRKRVSPFDKRIHEIDFIRGLLIFLVVFDHIMNRFAFNNEFFPQIIEGCRWYWYSQPRYIVRFFALIGFCFISGVSCAFSRNNWLRAGQMVMFWAVLAVMTNLLQSWGVVDSIDLYIPFNVIGVLAWSTLFYCFIQNKSWRGILAMFLFAFLMAQYFIPWFTRINEIRGVTPHVPAFWEPTYWPGTAGRSYADWMPLFPFMAFFMLGAFASYFLYREKKQSLVPELKRNWEKPICFLGRHTLIIYVLHQIILVPIFMLLNLI